MSAASTVESDGPGPAPLIALTTSELRDSTGSVATPEGDPARHEMVLGLAYMKAIHDAGGVPVVVPPIDDEGLLDSLLNRVSGVCLTGGPDLDPVAYGARRHGRIRPTWRALDDCELTLARLADRRRLPVLAICRGLQAFNVARGGTLHQHLPDQVGELVNHRQAQPGTQATHWVSLGANSRVADIMGTARIKVNSFHHQAAADIGHGLVVTGRADDGTIECLEATDRDFLVGVQWHAGSLTSDAGQQALFRSFIDAARRHERSTGRLRSAA